MADNPKTRAQATVPYLVILFGVLSLGAELAGLFLAGDRVNMLVVILGVLLIAVGLRMRYQQKKAKAS